MKFVIAVIFSLSFAGRVCAAEGLPVKNAVLLVTPETAEGRAAVEKLKGELAAKGISVAEIPADEAQDPEQAAALNGGGPVITTENRGGKLEFKVLDGASGADITKSFNPGLEAPKAALAPDIKAVAAPVALAPEPAAPAKQEKAAAQPAPAKVFKRNHLGLSLGMSDFRKNRDSLDRLAENAGGLPRYTTTSGRVMLYYERGLSKKYTLGIAAGMDKGGGGDYSDGNRTLNVEVKPRTATLYLMRNFGRHFGLYAGGGASVVPFRIFDHGDFAGMNSPHPPFKGQSTPAHAEAGLAFTIKNFALRFSVREIFAGESGRVMTTVNGGRYVLVIKDGMALGTRAADQPYAPGEKPYKADFGGSAYAVALTYSFANW